MGDVTKVVLETLDIVRRMGELDEDGEFGSDSGNLGNCSILAVDELGSRAWCEFDSAVNAVRLLEVEESLCLLLLLEMTLRLSVSFSFSFDLGLTRAMRPCLS